ncbi:hypothetical protein SAMN05660772_02448 [Pasteurella testudinis DSM 23072]|uniref:Uncharacterized protein n=1 Tax=Pasteurella testudinis DSM 23072 TaxID=1122938 RepID=A0A1W1UVV6_9PAST|nr:hypothetical protein [Pasteurella testudinis]SMB85222.1 hypothetical protein SAMN05660772_02448 [Pasteurella testudinis DSM 23072]SUB52137.1 Uncharacterised protein [Pasteurella testudinis]
MASHNPGLVYKLGILFRRFQRWSHPTGLKILYVIAALVAFGYLVWLLNVIVIIAAVLGVHLWQKKHNPDWGDLDWEMPSVEITTVSEPEFYGVIEDGFHAAGPEGPGYYLEGFLVPEHKNLV